MNRIIKVNAILLLAIILIVTEVFSCYAQEILSGSINIPSQVTKSKNFTADIYAQYPGKIGVVMFTVVYGNDIEYKSCKVADGSSGYIESSQEDNTIKIIYINTAGLDISDRHSLVQVTFKAGSNKADSYVEVYTSYSTNIDEEPLIDNNGEHYNIEITDKAVENPSLASGTSVERNISSSSRGTQHSSSGDGSAREGAVSSGALKNSKSANDTDGDDEIPSGTDTQDSTMINVSSQNNNFMIFAAGGIFALAVAAVVLCSYVMGKKHKKPENTLQETGSEDNTA